VFFGKCKSRCPFEVEIKITRFHKDQTQNAPVLINIVHTIFKHSGNVFLISGSAHKIDPHYQRRKYLAGTLVSDDIGLRFMLIFAEALWKGVVRLQWVRASTQVLHIGMA